MNIAFLLGAGCEGKGQFELPSGEYFKRDTILARDVRTFAASLNGEEKLPIRNGTILRYNSNSTLYQTIRETDISLDSLSLEQRKVIDLYLQIKEKGESDPEIAKQFQDIYKTCVYENIVADKWEDNVTVTQFLQKASFFGFVDSYFNYLRKPALYQVEIRRVAKMYYAAYKSIIDGIKEKVKIPFPEYGVDIAQNRQKYAQWLDEAEKCLWQKIPIENTYYGTIRELAGKDGNIVNIVTCNYTGLIDRTLGDRASISHIHGKLNLFESIDTKEIRGISEFSDAETVIPYILIQSGVKPIISPYQIEVFAKANTAFASADIIVVLGYGANSDDEHIVTMLRHYVLQGKRLVYFEHCDQEIGEDRKKQIYTTLKLKEDQIRFVPTGCWYDFVRNINKYAENN